MDSLNGEEKKDASKEDLEQEEGGTAYSLQKLFENSEGEIDKRRLKADF